jgi:hypothetical protein
VQGPAGPTGPTGPSGQSGLLRALTAGGSDLGIVYFYERSFPVQNAASPATNSYLPFFAVKEPGAAGTAYMLLRLLYTGTPVPCPVYYVSADCSGTPIGMDIRAATGFACGMPSGHVGWADPTVAPTTVPAGSNSFGRYDGTDLVLACIPTSGTVPLLPILDLGPAASVNARVYLQAAQ